MRRLLGVVLIISLALSSYATARSEESAVGSTSSTDSSSDAAARHHTRNRRHHPTSGSDSTTQATPRESQPNEPSAAIAPQTTAPTAPAPPTGSPKPALAQTVQELPPVVVTATRLEQPISQIGTSVSVIGSKTIDEQKLQRVDQALREVPGVEITQSGSGGTIAGVGIRGANPSESLVLVDGVEVNDATTSDFDLADVTTDDLSRIEVLRGAGGALYGSSAIGGVINILTREGEGRPRFSLLSEGGNRGTERQLATFSGSYRELGYSGAISYFSTEGFRPFNDASDNLSGVIRLDEHLTRNTTLRGIARYNRSNVGLVNFSNFVEPLDPNAHQRNEFMLYKGEIEHHFNDRLTVRWNGAFVRNEIRLNKVPDPGNLVFESDDIPNETRSTTLEGIYEWMPGTRSVVGFDFKDRWARAGDHFAAADGSFESITRFSRDRREFAGYAEQQASLLSGLILLTAGFRADGNSDFGKAVSPGWSVAIPIQQAGLILRGSYSEGFRAPSFNELFFPGFGNPDLIPETSSEYDGGFTQNFGELASFTATYFSRRIHDVIFNAVPCDPSIVGTPSCMFGIRPGNAERLDVQGVELEPTLNVTRDLKLGGNFTVIDSTHRSVDPGIRPVRAPRHSAAGVLQYAHSAVASDTDRVSAAIVYTFFGDRDDFDPMQSQIRSHAGYHRFDVVLAYSLGIRTNWLLNEQVYARVQNIADRNYSEAFAFKSPPINAVGGIKLDF